MSSKGNLRKSFDGMENVELHRAESLVTDPGDIFKQDEEKFQQTGSNETDVNIPTSRARRCFSVLKDMKIEVVMFLYMFSAIMRTVSTTTLIMDKVCYLHLNYPNYVCSNLTAEVFKQEKTAVEKLANNYQVGHGMIQLLPAAFIAVFIGSWSDKYGRKVPIIAALLGIIIDGLGTAICSFFTQSRAEFLLIPAIFTGLSGGMISCLTVVYSYAADTTTIKQRTFKYAFLEIAFGLSMPLGQLAGGWLFKYASYMPVFLVSTAGHVFCLGWVLFVLKETKGLDNKDNWRTKLRNLFSLQPVMDSFRASVKKRPNRGKEQILLITLAMSISVLTYASAGSISYLYAHHMYGWENTKYSTISAVFAVLGMAFVMMAVPLFKYFKISEPIMGIIGSASMLAKNLALGIATKVEVYFLANLLGFFSGIAALAGRSRISKVTSKEDIGKVFSLLSAVESLLPIIGSAVISQIFNATLDVYPGIIFLGLAVLLAIPLGVYIWMATLPSVNYEEMSNDNQEEVNGETKEPEEPLEIKKMRY